jgi:Spy/CpxP family protein refolding chaperone
MKKWMVTAALLVFVGMGAFAQDMKTKEKPDPETRAKMMTDRMAEKLELNDEQKAKILAINLEYAKKREAEMEAKKAEMEARKAEMDARRAEMKEQDSKIEEVLTPEQKEKWVELKDQGRSRRGPRGEVHSREDFRKRRGGN